MISVAVTHFNRFDMLCESIEQVTDDERIAEFVIVDDASTDGSWACMTQKWDDNPKFSLHLNPQNLDCYANKAQAVRKSTSPWVLLFDSDNILTPSYIDALYRHRWERRTAYLPVFARPSFDYREFEGAYVDRQNIGSYADRPMFLTALNTANHFFARDEYLRVWDEDTDPHNADSIYMNYRWLDFGNRLFFVPGLAYEHRIHVQSHFMQNATPAYEQFRMAVEDRLREMR